MAIVVCIAVVAVILVVTFASMVMMLGAPKELYEPSLMRGYSLTAMLRGACDTDDCRTAVGALNTSIDASANPCQDVYQYACGHWHMLDDDGKPLSYEDQLKHNYVTAVHANITGTATTDSLCRSSEPRAKIGCVYCSCVEFYTNRSYSLENLWTAAKIDRHEWMKTDDSEVLFYLVVRTILQTNVPSVLNVTRRDSTTAIVEIGRCISCSSADDDFLKFLLYQAVSMKVVDSQAAKRLQTDFEQLDEELMSVPSTPQGANVVDGDKSMFDIVPQTVWQKALAASHAGFSSRYSDLRILSSNSAGVGKVVAALNIVTLEIAKLYTLLAPVAPFMAVAHFETQKRTSMTLFEARSACLENVEYLFTIPFETAVASFLGTEKAAVAFNNLWSNVRLAGVNALRLGDGLELDKNALMAASVGVEEASGLSDPSFVEDYDGDFLSNLVRYKRKGRRNIRASEFRSDAPRKSGFLPTTYFVADYYYAGATEVTLNSGTLGALTAAMMFRKSFPKLASEPTSYVNCFVDYARQSVKLDVDRADWLTNTRVRWVAEVALMATRQGTDDRRHKEMEALYYLRFARTYCGEKEANRRPLLFALHSSPHFNKTFECSYSYPPMAC